MCGIAGAVGAFEPNRALNAVKLMTSALAHRGPDDHGDYSWQCRANVVVLGHTRLSILDLSPSGHQPMTESTQRYWITFNGEIYNYQELRLLLDPSNRLFGSTTDTEAILHAFHRWRKGSFGQLRGMFAFALLDQHERKLYLVRDPLGIKPLYYYSSGEKLLFASEVHALLASGEVPRQLNPESVTHFLTYGWIGKEATAVAHVRQLQPGEILTVDLSRPGVETNLSSYESEIGAAGNHHEADRSECAAHMLHILRQSVKAHLVSDVPVGLFLSGGIDSSAILHLMKVAGCDLPRTFNISFPEQDFDESRFATRIANQYGADHQELPLSESDLLAQIPDALGAMDQPTMDGVNTYVISKAVRSTGVKVALSGVGSDELFAGYPSFRRARWARIAQAVPGVLRRGAARVGRGWKNDSRFEKAWDLLASNCTPASAYSVSRQVFSPKKSRSY